MKNMKEILEYLAKEEDVIIHKNEGESDITSPYGVYKSIHPNAEIFKLIDEIAAEVGINFPSTKWTQHHIDLINIQAQNYKEELYELAAKFYSEYLKGAHLNMFPPECRVTMYSMYVLGSATAWKAVQKAIKDFDVSGVIPQEKTSPIDGDARPGGTTLITLNWITRMTHNERFGWFALRMAMISNMREILADLSTDDPKEYLHFLDGWNNRMSRLEQMR